MSKVSVGTLAIFNHDIHEWSLYKDRLEQWFMANDLGDTVDKSTSKRRAILLSSLSENTYKLVRDLALPLVVGNLDYSLVVKLLDDHFKVAKCGFAERHKFFSSTQLPSETFADWAARVRGLAIDCDFPASALSETLRDRFVLGMALGPERDKLFTMKMSDLTLTKAVETAEAIRCARQGAAQSVQPPAALGSAGEAPVFKMSVRNDNRAGPSGSGGGWTQAASVQRRRDVDGGKCSVCGFGHHVSACKFRNYKCDRCGVKGHLRRMCPRKVQQNFIECCIDDDDGDDGKRVILNLRSYNSDPMRETVLVSEHKLSFEIDTGSAVTVIPEQVYKTYFSEIPLSLTKTILQSYNGSNIVTLGTLSLPFTFRSRTENMRVFVVRDGGPLLLGRDFCSQFNLRIATVNSCTEGYLNKLISKYPKLFTGELGLCANVSVDLKLKPDSNPIFFKARPVPFALRGRIEEEISRLQKLGILVPVKLSDYASPVVPVLKRDGKIRLCADYSVTLNKQLVIEKYPLPRIDELFAKLHGGQQFSKLDLSRAYNQLSLNESSQMLTCINTHKGLYKFTRLVFGLSSAAAIFQRTIEGLLAGLEGVLIFQDDILVTGKNETEHLERLDDVCRRLEQAGLVLQRDKCSLFQSSVTYLGFIIDSQGLHKCPDKVKAIVNAKAPSNVSELKSFLGLVNYYRNFVDKASSILAPLHCLLQKNVPWQWKKEHDIAVAHIKRQLASEKILAHFNPNAELILTVDASPTGLGAILSQVAEDNIERPISYASRSLTSAEKSYSQIQKEATAIIFGVRKYHQYLYGRAIPFVLRTDHKPLLSIFNPDKGIPEVTANRLQRYAIFLTSYNFQLEYVSSVHNTADFLSRSSVSQSSSQETAASMCALDRATYVNFVYENERFINITDVSRESNLDEVLSLVIKYVNEGWPSKMRNEKLKPFFMCRNELSVENACLIRGHQVVIPTAHRVKILEELHIGHLGSSKMKAEARNRFWWPGMSNEIDIFISQCDACNCVRPSPPLVPLNPWPFPPQPWFRVHVDFLGPIHNKTYLIIVDAYSKWVECYDVSTGYGSEVVIEKLCDVMARFGLFHTVCSDNGTSFVSERFKSFCTINGITHLTSPAYNPISNGQAESYVKIIKKAIKTIIVSGCNKNNLNIKLNEFLLRYRNSKHSTTNRSPAEILFGRKLRCRLDTITTSLPASSDATLDLIVKDKQFSQCKFYAGKRKINFAVGEEVLVKVYKCQKPCWVKGTVVEQIGKTLYMIRVLDGGKVFKKHANQLLKIRGEKSEEAPADSPCVPNPGAVRPSESITPFMPTVLLETEQSPAASTVEAPSEADVFVDAVDLNAAEPQPESVSEGDHDTLCPTTSLNEPRMAQPVVPKKYLRPRRLNVNYRQNF